ncbi:MAG: LemA family protein [Chromatiales bacterium]|nr:LemA family protein [Chromatiales bacterium]
MRDRNRVNAAWSDIDVQLKRRYDLIPQLVEAVRQYAAYERATLSAVIELRNLAQQSDSVSERAEREKVLGKGMHQLIAVAEQYPQLKANESFLELQTNLTDVEDHIQYARRYYNGTVRNLNTRIDTFPDLIIARLFGYRHNSYFELESGQERQPMEIRL